MTPDEIVERYGQLPYDMVVLEILLKTPSKRLGQPLTEKDWIEIKKFKEQNDSSRNP